MKRKYAKGWIILSLILIMSLMTTGNYAVAQSVESVVQNARKTYYGLNQKIKQGKLKHNGGRKQSYDEWYIGDDWRNYIFRKVIIYPNSALKIKKGYTSEYYYDSKEKLVFAFAYSSKKGHVLEHRAYYGTDGKLYRYINSKGVEKNYRNGIEPYKTDKIPESLWNKGTYYISLIHESELPDSEK